MDRKIKYIIEVEINTLNPESILNLCIANKIYISNVRKINKATLSFETFYENYKDLSIIVKRNGGKIKITKEKGNIIKIKKLKKRISFFIGGVIFLGGILFLSRFVWAIDISTEKNLSPFEIREVLKEIGIKQGMSKSKIDVYEIEREIENKCSDALWIKARIEGSTLSVEVKEKVNPPKQLTEDEEDIYAEIPGEIKRIYAEKGTCTVKQGDVVKRGDVLIEGYMEGNGEHINTKARGKVIANTFYTKEIEVKIKGTEEIRTENDESEFYVEILGKKIYLKKFSNSFENYDKIESNEGIIKKVTYHEKKEVEINKNKEEIIKDSIGSLTKLLEKELPIDAKIINCKTDVFDSGEGKIKIIGEFTVEQNIANR